MPPTELPRVEMPPVPPVVASAVAEGSTLITAADIQNLADSRAAATAAAAATVHEPDRALPTLPPMAAASVDANTPLTAPKVVPTEPRSEREQEEEGMSTLQKVSRLRARLFGLCCISVYGGTGKGGFW